MPLAGRRLTFKWALALGYHVGFRGSKLTTAIAIMCAESGRYVEAYHNNLAADGVTIASIDRGLFQINSVHDSKLSPTEAFKAIPNASFAYILSQGGEDFTPWSAYNNNAHLKFIPLVMAVRALGTWRERINKVESELG